eukprot:COSAG05_NODE_4425_length_1522_cov_1.569923_4_plen_62_part_00
MRVCDCVQETSKSEQKETLPDLKHGATKFTANTGRIVALRNSNTSAAKLEGSLQGESFGRQ